MPELPEVETTRRGLAAVLAGRRIEAVVARRADLRFPLPARFAERLAGRTVKSVDRRAKFLLIALDDGQVLIAHLGMSGSFKVVPAGDRRSASVPVPPPSRHDHVVLTIGNGGELRFHDPRRFGFLDLVDAAGLDEYPMLRGLGPEPLGADFSVTVLETVLAGRRGPIKAALLDQRVVAGLGNIYVCEALYYAGISPRRRAGTIPGARARRLVPAIRRVLMDAIDAGGSSLRDFQHTDGELGYFQKQFAVYGREGLACPACADADDAACAVRRIVQSGRSSFYCPRRQR